MSVEMQGWLAIVASCGLWWLVIAACVTGARRQHRRQVKRLADAQTAAMQRGAESDRQRDLERYHEGRHKAELIPKGDDVGGV